MNRVTIAGTLTADPDLKTGDNYKLCKISVETIRKVRKGRGESATGEQEVEVIEVTIWGATAGMVKDHFRAGSGILIDGRLKVEKWEKDGKQYSKLGVVAEAVEFPPGGKRAATAAALEPVRKAVQAALPVAKPASQDEDAIPF